MKIKIYYCNGIIFKCIGRIQDFEALERFIVFQKKNLILSCLLNIIILNKIQCCCKGTNLKGFFQARIFNKQLKNNFLLL